MVENLVINPIDPRNIDDQTLDAFVSLSYLDFKDHRFPLPAIPRKLLKRSLKIKPPSYGRYHRYVGLINNEMIAKGYWRESFEETNTNRSMLYIYVKPEFRKQGIGRMMMKYILDQTPDKIYTITMLVKNSKDIDPPGTSSLDKKMEDLGGKLAYTNVTNASDVTLFDEEESSKMAARLNKNALKKGFDIILIKDGAVRDSPHFEFEDYLKMRETIWNDMPTEDLTQEDEVLTPEESDEWFRVLTEQGFQIYTYLSVHLESGKIAGISEVHFNPEEPTIAFQEDTGVLREYRGNKLGLTLKYQILALLRNSKETNNVKWWMTGNANSNEHMLRINDMLGYEPVYRLVFYEFDKEALIQQMSR